MDGLAAFPTAIGPQMFKVLMSQGNWLGAKQRSTQFNSRKNRPRGWVKHATNTPLIKEVEENADKN